MFWLHPATLGDVSIAILAGAGLLLGVWFMARGSRARAREEIARSDAQSSPAGVAAAEPVASPAPAPANPTTFRHGRIRLVSEPGLRLVSEPSSAKPEPETPPAAPPPLLRLSEPEPEPETPPAAPSPPPFPQAPRTSFRQGRIRLGGIERGPPPREPDEGPPDAA
jgi:hypothetical protein